MNEEIDYTNNPLHGVSLKNILIEMVDHYDFEMLHAYLNINCFKTKPSIDSSVKFLKKTDWAREKVEAFYLYQFKNLPRASDSQFLLPPRERIIPSHQSPGEPAQLSLEDAERLREKRAKKALERDQGIGTDSNRRPSHTRGGQNRDRSSSRGDRAKSSNSSNSSNSSSADPWSSWK